MASPLRSISRCPKWLGSRLCHSHAAPEANPVNARLRFAPSPTGHLHLGGLRTALFNHLLARKWKGKWLLRIEDTDRTRYQEGAVDSLRSALDWAGLDYDEGVGAGGSHGPYTQSERLDIYQHYSKQLVAKGEAYECFCTPTQLEAIKMSLKKQGLMHSYDGRCRHLTEEDVARRKKAGHTYVVRYKNESGKLDLPADMIYGDRQPTAVIGPDDFVLMKSDGWPTYHLASVVDDHLMEITHVLRGEEWLASVPKHHRLYTAFGWTPPRFAHLPLLCNPDGTKLSKRKGDTFVEHYIRRGYEPDALLNFLALMGWDYQSIISPSFDPQETPLDPHVRSDGHSLHELFSLTQLIESFDPSYITHRKASVDQGKLDFLNKMTLRRKAGRLGADGSMINALNKEGNSEKEKRALVQRFQTMLKEEKALRGCVRVDDLGYVEKVLEADLPRTVILKDMPLQSIFYFLPPTYTCQESQLILKTINPRLYCQYIGLFAETLQHYADKAVTVDSDLVWDVIHKVIDELHIAKKPQLLVPLRHALTERKKGPGVPELVSVLGLEESLSRLRRAEDFVRERLEQD
ncbi:glutamate-tRNA ligase [Cryptococcus wingfieldii CBS 7118]|uniref:Glutamate--tRNA ligase, mitochondrial n=1 Tax=Cryptococcus wingfieldii CBS 7118 TaxID=1295528 RepID=A0A1E3JML0_9TREE|nr:glutamate-tRNA ligase [Cryptococcus wingfieldii CBS 7118]ODO02098.1 glutamate-tRNA ligase [Cryptococcus wingfieldii CBS 7118]